MGTRDVYVVDVDSRGVIISEPMRASSEIVGANGSSDWSPDGKQLTFFRRRDDRWSLVIKPIDVGRSVRSTTATWSESVGRAGNQARDRSCS